MAAAIGGLVGIGTGIAGAAVQSSATKHAADLQYKAAQESNALQKQEFQTQQQNLAPWLASGTQALKQLGEGTAVGGNLVAPYYHTYSNPDFVAPTAADAANSPGQRFMMEQGQQALARQQASTGITGGGAAKEIERYAQGLAASTYGNVFNQALQGYQANSQNNFSQYTTNANQFYGEQSNAFNKLSSLAGLGQSATSQLNAAGANYANQVGQNTMGAANAQGAAALSQGNIWAGALTGAGSSLGGILGNMNKTGNN